MLSSGSAWPWWPDAARGTHEAATVTGSRVDAWLVERIAAAPDSLEACLDAGLLLTEGTHLVFRHELLRERCSKRCLS
jgi:hypothetical protein